MFALGSTSKKRPNNLIMGRMFNFQLLDMVECGVSNFMGVEEFKGAAKCQVNNKPCFVFAGQDFETKAEYECLKSMLLDMFRGRVVDNINLKVRAMCDTALGQHEDQCQRCTHRESGC